MTLQIPYEFHPGEKALSQQVNANFEAIQTSVNAVEGSISQIQTNITTLQNNKANINGNSNNTFSVASPVNNYDAVNKQYLNALTQYMLAGLVISKADNEYISCTAGACYDTTGSKILQFASDVSISEAPYNVSATYYVYIVGMPSGGTNTQLMISSSSSSPALPSGYTLYRGLGYFTTDSEGNIDVVSAYGYSTGVDTTHIYYKTIRFPDLSSGISKSWDTLYTATEDGWVYVITYAGSSGRLINYLYVNDVEVFRSGVFDSNCIGSGFIPIKTGDTYKATGGNGDRSIKFYPMRSV